MSSLAWYDVFIVPFFVKLYVWWKRAQAIHLKQSSVDLFFGGGSLVLWSPNEGIVILRNNHVRLCLEGDGTTGGWATIWPILGDSFRGPVAVNRQITRIVKEGVNTCESIPVDLTLTIEWRVVDVQKFVFEMESGVRTVDGAGSQMLTQQQSFRLHETSEARLVMLVTDVIRRLVSTASMPFLIAPVPSSSFHPSSINGPVIDGSNIARLILEAAAPAVANADFGVQLRSVEVQSISLPDNIREAITQARVAVYNGHASQTQVGALAQSLGMPTVQLMHILQATPAGFFGPAAAPQFATVNTSLLPPPGMHQAQSPPTQGSVRVPAVLPSGAPGVVTSPFVPKPVAFPPSLPGPARLPPPPPPRRNRP